MSHLALHPHIVTRLPGFAPCVVHDAEQRSLLRGDGTSPRHLHLPVGVLRSVQFQVLVDDGDGRGADVVAYGVVGPAGVSALVRRPHAANGQCGVVARQRVRRVAGQNPGQDGPGHPCDLAHKAEVVPDSNVDGVSEEGKRGGRADPGQEA